MNDVMLDLETMGNGTDAAIVAIGAQAFDAQGLGPGFYAQVDLASSVAGGGVIDASTVQWWLRQSPEARAALNREGAEPLQAALARFSAWMAGLSDQPAAVKVWGNGAAFDNAILRNAYQRAGVPTPWKFWNDRCYRTLKNLVSGVDAGPFDGVQHHALADAKHQAQHAIRLLTRVG